jgi:hypothetical protein
VKGKRFILTAVAVALSLAVALAVVAASKTSRADAAPLNVDQVPAAIPAQGVTLLAGYADITLMPPTSDLSATPTVSAEKALTLAPVIDSPSPPSTVLAIVTAGSTLPPPGESAKGYNAVDDRLAWVITYAYPEPIDVRQGKLPTDGASPPSPLMRSHVNFIIDAQSGAFLIGFFTE